MAGRALRAAVIVLGMLAVVQQTMQLKITHPVPNFETEDQINSSPPAGPFFGVIMSSRINEKALNNSDLWKPSYKVDIAGRRFRIGTLNGVEVVAVIAGSLSAQASATAQMMLDYFKIRGIVHIGSALTIDNSFSVGSVSVVKSAAFTGFWTWEPLREKLWRAVSQMRFGDYGYPNPGSNFLGTIAYEMVRVFKPEYTPSPAKAFFHEVDSELYDVAANKLKDVKLKKCYNSSHCLPKQPELALGLKASTADIYVENPYYAKFLHQNFKVSTTDTQTATVIMTANANGTPVIVFRAASSSLNEAHDSAFSYLASQNVVTVAAKFVALFPTPRSEIQSY